MRQELGPVISLAWPVVITYTLQVSLGIVSVTVLGRLGEEALAAAALGNLYVNLFGNAPASGLATAVDTLAAQAFGAGNFMRVGLVSQRAAVLLLLGCIPSALMFFIAEPVLLATGQDPAICALAGLYCRCMVIALPATQLFETAKKFLQAQTLTLPPMVAAGVAVILNAIGASALALGTPLGFAGAPIATGIATWVALLLLLWYCRARESYAARVEAEAAAIVRSGAALREVELVGGAASSRRAVDDTTLPLTVTDEEAGSDSDDAAAGAAGAADSTLLAGSDADDDDRADASGAGRGGARGPAARGKQKLGDGESLLRSPRPGGAVAVGKAASGSAAGPPAARADSGASSCPACEPMLPLTAGCCLSCHAAVVRRAAARVGAGGTASGGVEDALLVRSWPGWSWRGACSGWCEFLMLGLPGAVMTTLEWGTFEINAIFAGWLGVTQLAAHSTLALTGALSFMVPLGLSVAASVRIGTLMGDGQPGRGKAVLAVALASGAAFTALNALVLLSARYGWGFLFTSDEAVVAAVAGTLPSMALFNVFDTTQAVLSGAVRGVGRQAIGAAGNLVAYCGVGLGMSYFLSTSTGMGLSGIWLGSGAGACLACLLLATALGLSNWKSLSDTAIRRAEQDTTDTTG